jgi:hypothetical protein
MADDKVAEMFEGRWKKEPGRSTRSMQCTGVGAKCPLRKISVLRRKPHSSYSKKAT